MGHYGRMSIGQMLAARPTALAVECPYCRAPSHAPCRARWGERDAPTFPHPSRYERGFAAFAGQVFEPSVGDGVGHDRE